MLPIGTNNRLRRSPTANYVLILVNALIFIAPFILSVIADYIPFTIEITDEQQNQQEHRLTPKEMRKYAQDNLHSLSLHPDRPQLY